MAAELIREQAQGVLGRRQWWRLGTHTAVVAYGERQCGISVTDDSRHDVTQTVIARIQARGVHSVNVIESIDTQLIGCGLDEVGAMLAEVEAVLL